MSNRFAYRGHHDANHPTLEQCFRDLGCTVADTSATGYGFPDLTIGLIGQTHLIEVKDSDGKLSPAQERFIGDWRGGRIVVVQTVDECIAHVQAIRRSGRAA